MKVPYWLLVFVFMLNVGLMFWALESGHKVLAVFSIALCCALPYVPQRRE